ncbi:Membrane-bound lysozyme-inhibitor of c-type lysozyme [Enhydrobacter aerosaccus]|uniref:Membrane-bound lysozyme-inhibitor of c-type lysozyme n=1 Tax=Enhydrobacter aerosaccus TaxID=225324 RepID=A0A1T4N9F9_9HYPH|nr:MliC family protein [Enhydrobacter aerosaccus]SJZ75697.1 Membrane-bound lysozyme-inhibitor of c-type lysozyme [Enhydrobacter aerosaccus]
MRRLPFAAIALLAPLGACVQQGPATAVSAPIARPSPDDLVPRGIAYACENQKEVTVVYAKNRATVTFENKTWRTEYQPTGDGFRYADSSVQWVGRDDLAALRENSSTSRPLAFNCRPTRRTTAT